MYRLVRWKSNGDLSRFAKKEKRKHSNWNFFFSPSCITRGMALAYQLDDEIVTRKYSSSRAFGRLFKKKPLAVLFFRSFLRRIVGIKRLDASNSAPPETSSPAIGISPRNSKLLRTVNKNL